MHTGPRSLRLIFVPDAPAPSADETLLRVDYGAQTHATDAGLELALPPLGDGPFAEIWSSDRIAGRGASGGFRWVRFGGRLFAWAVFDEDDGLEAASRRAYAELLALARAQGCPRLVRVWNYLPDLARDGRYQVFCAGRRRAMTENAAALAAPLPAATTTGSSAPGLAVLALTAARIWYTCWHGLQRTQRKLVMIADTVVLMAMGIGLAALGFLWNLHRDMGALRRDISRDMGDLRDRVSRIEGMLAGAGLKVGSDSASK